MHQPINVFGQTNKQTKFGDIADFAFNFSTDWIGCGKVFPWIGCALLQAERNAALRQINIKHHNFNLLAG